MKSELPLTVRSPHGSSMGLEDKVGEELDNGLKVGKFIEMEDEVSIGREQVSRTG
jgi:hypothetical protein